MKTSILPHVRWKNICIVWSLLLLIAHPLSANLEQLSLGSSLSLSGTNHLILDISRTDGTDYDKAAGNILTFCPAIIQGKRRSLSLTITQFEINKTPLHNSHRYRKFIGLGLGLDFGVLLHNQTSVIVGISSGIGELSHTDNKEGFMALHCTTQIPLYQSHHQTLCLSLPVSFTYRKNIISPSIGVGLTIHSNFVVYVREKRSKQ